MVLLFRACLSVELIFLCLSACCGGDRAPSGTDSRGLGTTTGRERSHAGGTAGTGRSSLLTGGI